MTKIHFLYNLIKKRDYKTIKYLFARVPFRMRWYSPDYVTLKEWDKLLVLDACTFNLFESRNRITGTLSKIKSPGSDTPEWLVENFKGRSLSDVVYISGNPYGSYYKFAELLGSNPFYKVLEVWKNKWDPSLATVYPSEINKEVIIAQKMYPTKRMIIHYMQPHFPFIGEKGLRFDGVSPQNILANNFKEGYTVWDALLDGKIKPEEAYRAYESNFDLVLKYVLALIPRLKGKVCITSDHGNLFGKYGVFYGHPRKLYHPELIEVPWLEVQ
jgi:hypothetical protein